MGVTALRDTSAKSYRFRSVGPEVRSDSPAASASQGSPRRLSEDRSPLNLEARHAAHGRATTVARHPCPHARIRLTLVAPLALHALDARRRGLAGSILQRDRQRGWSDGRG